MPAFVNWPAVIRAGGLVESPLHIVDWAPTLIRLAGGRLSDDLKLDGQDIWPLLSSQKRDVGPRPLYWKTPRESAVRYGPWKLIVDRRNPSLQLFNVAQDPYETTDRSDEHPQEVEELRRLLEELAKADR